MHLVATGKDEAVFVAAGQAVAAGDRLAILEAMKMEHTLTAARDGVVAEVLALQPELQRSIVVIHSAAEYELRELGATEFLAYDALDAEATVTGLVPTTSVVASDKSAGPSVCPASTTATTS